MLSQDTHGLSLKNASPFGPAVWPTIAHVHIYTNIFKESASN